MHFSSAAYDTGALAPSSPSFTSWSDVAPSMDRDVRVASALRIRIDNIDQEIAELEDSRDHLTASLREVEQRIAHSCRGRA